MSILHSLEPAALWRHFAAICAIPHPSRQEAALIAHIEAFAERLGLPHLRDRAGNLIIRKPASPGLEQSRGVVLQSHLDMVPQKRDASSHDFSRDPIRPRLADGWVSATDTTLGADNGIGVAAILALLEDRSLRHGPLEALLTVNEEAGMEGALGLEGGILQGSLLLNLDSEQEGELYVGCAGGIDASATLPLERQTASASAHGLTVLISGLAGGHSGVDIHLPRGNANRLLAELLLPFIAADALALCRFEGGSLRNAIARNAEALLSLPGARAEALQVELQQAADRLVAHWAEREPGLRIQLLTSPASETPLQPAAARRLIDAVLACPHGVYAMDPQRADTVETSNNLARVITGAHHAELLCLARSAREAGRDELCAAITATAQRFGGRTAFDGAYPGWTPDYASPLLATLNQLHQELFGQEAEVKVIHAGLECGLLAAAYPHWQMISFGPTIRFPHSPSEKVEVASVARFWHYLTASLERLATV